MLDDLKSLLLGRIDRRRARHERGSTAGWTTV
jgi:hypothetical protein